MGGRAQDPISCSVGSELSVEERGVELHLGGGAVPQLRQVPLNKVWGYLRGPGTAPCLIKMHDLDGFGPLGRQFSGWCTA